MRFSLFPAALAALVCAGASGAAKAQDASHPQITIRDHKFAPAELHVPSGKPVFVEVVNADATPEEFESGILAIEKVVTGGGHIRVHLPALAPGRYPFFGEFHEATAQGAVVADPPAQ